MIVTLDMVQCSETLSVVLPFKKPSSTKMEKC